MLRFIIQFLSWISYLMFVFILFLFCVQIVNNEMLPQKSSRGKTSPLLDETLLQSFDKRNQTQ